MPRASRVAFVVKTQRLGTAALSNHLPGPHCNPPSWGHSGNTAWAGPACLFVCVGHVSGVSRGLSVLDVQVDRLRCHRKSAPKQPTSPLLLQVWEPVLPAVPARGHGITRHLSPGSADLGPSAAWHGLASCEPLGRLDSSVLPWPAGGGREGVARALFKSTWPQWPQDVRGPGT